MIKLKANSTASLKNKYMENVIFHSGFFLFVFIDYNALAHIYKNCTQSCILFWIQQHKWTQILLIKAVELLGDIIHISTQYPLSYMGVLDTSNSFAILFIIGVHSSIFQLSHCLSISLSHHHLTNRISPQNLKGDKNNGNLISVQAYLIFEIF